MTTIRVMVLVPILLASALVVRNDGTELKPGCEDTARPVATLSAGSAVEVLFSLTSSRGTCYKVAVSAGDRKLTGYLEAESLSGTDAYRAEVQAAPALGTTRPVQSPVVRGPRSFDSAPQAQSGPEQPAAPNPLARASSLLDQKQPQAALEAVEQGMKTYGRAYQFLVLAGIAAQAADQPRVALDYLREAQQHQQDHSIQQLIARLEKEVEGDKSGNKLYGNRFVLRYEEGKLDPEVARSMVGLLEQEFSRISAELGCRTDERIVTIVQSKQAYRAASNAAEWSGGHFDGTRIRVPIGESGGISPQTRETFSHELVHACLAGMGHWPAWLHEGFAQKLTGRTPSASSRQTIHAMLQAGKLPRLDNMSQSWSRMSAEHAHIAYQYALIAVEALYELNANFGIQNVLRAPDRLPDVSARIDQHLLR